VPGEAETREEVELANYRKVEGLENEQRKTSRLQANGSPNGKLNQTYFKQLT